MKGIVFNLLEEVTVNQYGAATWDQLLTAAELDGAYTSLGSYPDQQMGRLVSEAARLLQITQFEVLRWFGRNAMPLLFVRYPDFFLNAPDTRAFLLSVNNIIHPEVRKVYPGAQVPTFEFHDLANGDLLMGYNSPRRLCALAQGFAEGAAAYFGDSVAFDHLECMHQGDPRCLCRISFALRQTN